MTKLEKFGQVCVCQDCKDEHTLAIAKYGKELLDNVKLQQENAALRQQIENMKNCDNCQFGDCDEDGIYCTKDKIGFECNWQMKGAE
jgi:hypothetical protein